MNLHKAAFNSDGACGICPKRCVIKEGGAGACRTRRNDGGTLYALNYAAVTSYGLDRVEKKPLYHFYPGKMIVSLGTWGCNFSCRFCQNHEISQGSPQITYVPPEMALKLALESTPRGNIGLAYTYSEPAVWFEYVLDTARLVKKAGLKNVLVTNGFINSEPLEELLPYIDAMNIDVKSFNDNFYRDVCGGRLADTLRTVERAARSCHVEITNLLVPGLNDNPEEIRAMSSWLKGIGENIPLHFSRYFPKYEMNLAPTPLEILNQAAQTAKEYLKYVYIGNVAGDGMNTCCPECGRLLIDRLNFKNNLTAENKCPACKSSIKIIGDTP